MPLQPPLQALQHPPQPSFHRCRPCLTLRTMTQPPYPRSKAATRIVPNTTASLQQQANPVNQKGDDPRRGNLKQHRQPRPSPNFRTPCVWWPTSQHREHTADRHHQTVGVQRPKTQRTQQISQLQHAVGGVHIDNPKEHRSAGHHNFFGRDPRNQRNGNLPETKADGGENGTIPLPQQGAKAGRISVV